jgi:hypothetical protein
MIMIAAIVCALMRENILKKTIAIKIMPQAL